MSTKTVVIFLLLLYFDSIICKGLYSGVPCHRVYYCIVGEMNDVPEDSVLIGQEQNIEDEKTCQDLCFKMENCVTYSWWNEKAADHPEGSPFLCQMFSQCYGDNDNLNPNLTPVFSGPPQCKNPVLVFGGDSEDAIDPRMVETIWPSYSYQHFFFRDTLNYFDYVTINDFDPIPEIPELGFGSHWYSSAVQLDTNLILSCGGGPGGSSVDPPIPFTYGTATEKCFGLDLVTGTWKPMASMNYARTENFTLVSVDHGVLAIGGVRSGLPLIEIYNRDFDVWTPMPQWNDPNDPYLTGHCAVAIDDHQIMVIGCTDWGGYARNVTSKILDINTGKWRDTAPYAEQGNTMNQACLATTVNGIPGVMVTGGLQRIGDDHVSIPAHTSNKTLFYQIETDSWITLADTRYPVYNHQMVLFGNDFAYPTRIIGGEYTTFSQCDNANLVDCHIEYHKRDNVQPYVEYYIPGKDSWGWYSWYMNYKRSKFAAVSVKMQEP